MARSSRSVSSTFLNAKKCLHLRHKGNQDKIPLLGTNILPIWIFKIKIYFWKFVLSDYTYQWMFAFKIQLNYDYLPKNMIRL